MTITIAICTYNNASVLDITLESLSNLDVPDALEYEILVVDNNCTDNTSDVVAKHSEVLGSLRVLREPRQGLSYARNCALRESKGEYVSFIDDDVKVDPGWLVAIVSAFQKHNAALVGGKSYLIYPRERPEWLAEEYERYLSKLDYGDVTLVGTEKDLYGLNFSVLKRAAMDCGGFDTRLGRVGKNLLSGEETDLQKKITAQGGIVVYEPSAVVGHIVSEERLRQKWFLHRTFYEARFDSGDESDNNAAWGASLVHNGYRTLRCYLGLTKSLLLRDMNSEEYFEKQVMARRFLGYTIRACRESIGLS